jgi:hypothetical protein
VFVHLIRSCMAGINTLVTLPIMCRCRGSFQYLLLYWTC